MCFLHSTLHLLSAGDARVASELIFSPGSVVSAVDNDILVNGEVHGNAAALTQSMQPWHPCIFGFLQQAGL